MSSATCRRIKFTPDNALFLFHDKSRKSIALLYHAILFLHKCMKGGRNFELRLTAKVVISYRNLVDV